MKPLDPFVGNLEKPGGAWGAVNTAPALDRDTVGIELTGGTESVVVAKAGTLESRAQSETGHERMSA